jgi:hypothetical protein
MLRVLVEFFQITLMFTGELLQSDATFNFNAPSVPGNTSGPLPVSFKRHTKLLATGIEHMGFEPLNTALVIAATDPSDATEPAIAKLQVTGTLRLRGDFIVIVPAVVNALPAGAIVAALAVDMAPPQRAKSVTQPNVFKLFIVIPHRVWRVTSPMRSATDQMKC